MSSPAEKQALIRDALDVTKPVEDSPRVFEDMFSWIEFRHPFNALAATSTRCRTLVEWFCLHLVKKHNRFNLPFAHLEAHGPANVYPDMSRIVYRRLWLQTAPRYCVFCASHLSNYPHKPHFRLMLLCADCFYAQALSGKEEIEPFYHIPETVLRESNVRGTPCYNWALRVDVEALALKLYGTRAFHHTRRSVDDEEEPCRICRRAGVNNDFSLRRSKRVLAARAAGMRVQRRLRRP